MGQIALTGLLQIPVALTIADSTLVPSLVTMQRITEGTGLAGKRPTYHFPGRCRKRILRQAWEQRATRHSAPSASEGSELRQTLISVERPACCPM
jgi:hypothetical protein